MSRHNDSIERDGTESEAYLQLPASTLDSRVTELIEEQVAQTDYRLKAQAKQFWSFLADVQAVRRGAVADHSSMSSRL